MKVFISWSGAKSRNLAEQIYKWLPYMIQAVKPFLSSGDIRKGARWSAVLAQELQDTKYGIICITRQNVISPWLNFEAGALSKMIGQSCVSPLLFCVDSSKLQDPLSQFQATVFDEKGDDFFGLISSINNNLPEEQQLPPDVLKATFEEWWPKLRKGINEAKNLKTDETETGYPWLYSIADLKSTEANAEWKSVWVINPDPLKDWHQLVDTMHDNLKRGIRYDFIVPSNRKSELRRLILDEFDPQDPQSLRFLENLRIGCIEPKDYKSSAVTHYRVLNPKSDKSIRWRIFFEVPIEPHGYWIETKGEAVNGFHLRFADMLKQAKPEAVCSLLELPVVKSTDTPSLIGESKNEDNEQFSIETLNG